MGEEKRQGKKSSKGIKKKIPSEKLLMLAVAVVFVLLAFLIVSVTANSKKQREVERLAAERAAMETEVVTHAEIQDICPKEIREYVNTYPEAIELAGNFEAYSTKEVASRLEDSEAYGYPALVKWDKRWAYHKYGGQYMGISGSGPTALTIVVTGLTQDPEWSPAGVADWCNSNGYLGGDEGTQKTLFSQGVNAYGLDSVACDMSWDSVLWSFSMGRPVVCLMGPGDFAVNENYIVLVGQWSDGLIHLCDPNSRDKSVLHWPLENIAPQVKEAWSIGWPLG